jgi:hypothetical protein
MIEMAAIDWRYAQITSVITRLSSPWFRSMSEMGQR